MSRAKMIQIDTGRMKEAIKQSGLSQPEIAEKLGINYQALNHNINAGRISSIQLNAIASLTDSDPEYIKGNNDAELNYYGYKRGQAIENKSAIMENLFVLLGFEEKDYQNMTTNERESLLTDIDPIVAYHIHKSKWVREQQAQLNKEYEKIFGPGFTDML